VTPNIFFETARAQDTGNLQVCTLWNYIFGNSHV